MKTITPSVTVTSESGRLLTEIQCYVPVTADVVWNIHMSLTGDHLSMCLNCTRRVQYLRVLNRWTPVSPSREWAAPLPWYSEVCPWRQTWWTVISRLSMPVSTCVAQFSSMQIATCSLRLVKMIKECQKGTVEKGMQGGRWGGLWVTMISSAADCTSALWTAAGNMFQGLGETLRNDFAPEWFCLCFSPNPESDA